MNLIKIIAILQPKPSVKYLLFFICFSILGVIDGLFSMGYGVKLTEFSLNILKKIIILLAIMFVTSNDLAMLKNKPLELIIPVMIFFLAYSSVYFWVYN